MHPKPLYVPDIMFLDSLHAAAFSKYVAYINCKEHKPLGAHTDDCACRRTYKDDSLMRKLFSKAGVLAEKPITGVYGLCILGETGSQD